MGNKSSVKQHTINDIHHVPDREFVYLIYKGVPNRDSLITKIVEKFKCHECTKIKEIYEADSNIFHPFYWTHITMDCPKGTYHKLYLNNSDSDLTLESHLEKSMRSSIYQENELDRIYIIPPSTFTKEQDYQFKTFCEFKTFCDWIKK